MKKVAAVILVGVLALGGFYAVPAETGKSASQHSTKAAGLDATVKDFKELKTALEEDNNVTNIFLAQDISLDSGIKINPKKQSVVINGQGNKLTEKSRGVHGTIYVDTNNAVKEVSLKNINIVGKNFYGPVNVDDHVKGVTLNYENVNYEGPQLVHNVHGFANFSGVSKVKIAEVLPDTDRAQEFVEGLGVQIGGKLDVEHKGTVDSTFWFGLGNDSTPYLKIKDNADVSFDVAYDTLFYVDNSVARPLDITVGEKAKLKVNTTRELFRLGHAGSFELLPNSTTNIARTTAKNSNPTLKIRGVVHPSSGAVFNINHAPETKADMISGI
ncbi:pectate lyase-like adhesive domain-containing protein [Listeria sp. PSOL-1]|uniref:pectate lyase-like adhesive domain-containing protein n=1 Tax=Listeria sp. PSOL-1 TaxID=1844999 RepID=UPI0013D62535|nr:pectate lyase-like adhesive domain-containing protein [Listeria sp. PSOL-1]